VLQRLSPAIATTALLIASPNEARADEWSGPARVVDGDTLAIADIRLWLISLDAPESGQWCPDGHDRPFDCGREATLQLERLTAGQSVRCYGDKRDRFGRPLVVCFRDQLNLNAEMVRSGWAVTFLGNDYEQEETEARAAKRGLWAGSFERPVDWRRQKAR
jgi:endonuclease YncB( thermonuclease family)